MSRRLLAAVIFLLAAIVGFGVGRATSSRRNSPTGARPVTPTSLRIVSPELTEHPESEVPKHTKPLTVGDRPIGVLANPDPDPFDRFFEILLPLYADDAYILRKSLFAVTLRDKEAQAAVFDLIMSLDDPSMLEESGTFLTYGDAALVSRMVDAFKVDANPHRRAALAMALGQDLSFAEAQPVIESILTGRDPSLQAATLKWLTIESASKNPDLAGRLTLTLRNLVLTGETIAIRAAAATALKGDATEPGTRFLIDRILNDPNADVQKGAIGALSLGLYSIKPPLPADQLAALWTVFRNEARNDEVRRQAAHMILLAETRNIAPVTDDERKLLKSWTEAR